MGVAGKEKKKDLRGVRDKQVGRAGNGTSSKQMTDTFTANTHTLRQDGAQNLGIREGKTGRVILGKCRGKRLHGRPNKRTAINE